MCIGVRGAQGLLAGLTGACALTAALTVPLLLSYLSFVSEKDLIYFIWRILWCEVGQDAEKKNKILLPVLSQTGGIGNRSLKHKVEIMIIKELIVWITWIIEPVGKASKCQGEP